MNSKPTRRALKALKIHIQSAHDLVTMIEQFGDAKTRELFSIGRMKDEYAAMLGLINQAIENDAEAQKGTPCKRP